ncbi:hypothetical protein KAI46_06740 [bacterium]|nr:hypothetical protein [bacterium]
MGLLNGIKAIKYSLKEKVKKQVSEEFIDAAKKGEFVISQKYLEPPLRNSIKDEVGVEIETIDFNEEGITLNLKVDKLGTSLACPILIKVGSLILSGNQQQVRVTVVTEKTIGGNFFGKIATGLAGGIINRIFVDKIKDQEIVASSTTKGQQTDIEIDLSTLGPIQKLSQPLPVIGKSPLDFFIVESVHHIKDGLMLKLRRSF